MNAIKKIKIAKNLIEIAKIIEKVWNERQEKIKDAIWFFESYVQEAKPYIDNIKEILKNG